MPNYFSHDYNARNDPKLIKLQMEMGLEGIGIFWCLIEMMYEQSGYLLLSHCDRIAFALRVDTDKIKRVISDFDLFENDTIVFWNESCKKRIALRNEKSAAARNSVNKRWLYGRNTTVNSMEYDSNTIKERKGKEIKEIKEIKEKIQVPAHLLEIWPDYLAMRTKIKKPATERAQKNIIADLEKLAPNNIELQCKILEQSITNSWQGVFEFKEKNNQQKERCRLI